MNVDVIKPVMGAGKTYWMKLELARRTSMPGTTSLLDAMEVFASGKADAFVGFTQQPLEEDHRPWSQYF